jgi:3-oxoacyl-[acyl-carrier protein] reductase
LSSTIRRARRKPKPLPELCRDAGATEVIVVQGDVSKDDDCKNIVAAAQHWGRIDALINNAGMTKHVAA